METVERKRPVLYAPTRDAVLHVSFYVFPRPLIPYLTGGVAERLNVAPCKLPSLVLAPRTRLADNKVDSDSRVQVHVAPRRRKAYRRGRRLQLAAPARRRLTLVPIAGTGLYADMKRLAEVGPQGFARTGTWEPASVRPDEAVLEGRLVKGLVTVSSPSLLNSLTFLSSQSLATE